MTYKWKIAEEKAYRLSIPEHSFSLKDNKQLRLTISMVFKNKKDAEDSSKKREKLIGLLNSMFNVVESASLVSPYDMELAKVKLILELKKEGFPVEYISFDSYPKIL